MDGDRKLGSGRRPMTIERPHAGTDAGGDQHETPLHIDSLRFPELHSPQPVRKGT